MDVAKWKYWAPLKGGVRGESWHCRVGFFQVQGADVSGAVIFRKKAAMIASACVFLKPASLHGGDGGLRRWMRPVVGALYFVIK
jgi:hypothetical protein